MSDPDAPEIEAPLPEAPPPVWVHPEAPPHSEDAELQKQRNLLGQAGTVEERLARLEAAVFPLDADLSEAAEEKPNADAPAG